MPALYKNHSMPIKQTFLYCFFALLLASIFGCKSASSPLVTYEVEEIYVKKPFPFHKPNLGATFAMQALRNGNIDSTYHFTITDTAATHDGKSGVVEFTGYYRPFYISYHPSGAIYIWGSGDYIFGRNSWTSYPFAVKDGAKIETYSHDSIVSISKPNDTKKIERDTMTVVGWDTLMINSKAVECVRIELKTTLSLKSIASSFTSTSSLKIDYWYAPSIGYWAKEHTKHGADDITFTLIDYTL